MCDDVDDRLRALVPEVPVPDGRPGRTVLVTGPWLAGCTSLAAALRARMPEVTVVESHEPADAPPAVVVFAVSAAAPLVDSDCLLLDEAAARTDAVVGALTKIDVHHRWEDVLEADRTLVAAHHPRYAATPWVGVAAAPQLGETRVGDLVAELRHRLADPALDRRNRLQQWEAQIEGVRAGHDAAADDHEVVANRLRRRRADLLSEGRLDRSQRSIALRSQIQQARIQLSYFSRSRCTSVLTELQEDAAAMTRRGVRRFPPYVARRVEEVIGEVDDGVTQHLADVAAESGLSPVPAAAVPDGPTVGEPPLRSRRLETRLGVLLGAGFGLGVALTLSRLLADVAPGLAALGAVGCAVVGLAVTAWVIGTRGLLQDRMVLDRWVGEVMAAARAVTDQLVSTRVLVAESVLTTALADQDERLRRDLAERVGEVDARLREQALARTRAAAERDRAAPVLDHALAVVRAELNAHIPTGR
ncbi:MAG: hypothetical protein K0R68_3259 [Mycobacterium sp.]|nr:hypothetical protein [Mycobacterium sp.]